jgi:hypothetical protein
MMIQSGYMPTVLQQLCNLPFQYFSNPSLSCLLFPTLLACCSGNQQNRDILEQEVSYQVNYLYVLDPIREIAQFMNWAENEQRIAQFVKWARVICPVHELGSFADGVTYASSGLCK